MKTLTIVLVLFFLPLASYAEEKPCYVSLNSSKDFNTRLISNITNSIISQYLKIVKPFPSSGLSGVGHCIYEVTVTLDDNKTFVTMQGDQLNSFGESSSVGTDGFKESILRSLYLSQRDKRGLICSDYPNILEECGDVVKNQEVVQQPKQEMEFKKLVKSNVNVDKDIFILNDNSRLDLIKTKTNKNLKSKRDCSRKWKCVVPPCDDMIDKNGCLIED